MKSGQSLKANLMLLFLAECLLLFIYKYVEDGNEEMRKKKLYVPRVEDKNSHMRMLHISRINDLVANSMDILEPAPVDGDGNEREDGILFLAFKYTSGKCCV